MMKLPDKPPASLNQKQIKAWKAMVTLLQNTDEADQKYDAISESKNGRIISTDLARFLDDRYAQTAPGKLRDIEPSWDLAWRYAQDRFQRELRARNKRKIVRFMAGGWAAGKTHALENLDPPDLAWDGTLSDAQWSAEMIDIALQHKWKVEIAYVFRDIELAFYGAVERGNQEGRYVPLESLPKSHGDAQRSVKKLTYLYGNEENVSFIMLHNLGTKSVPCASKNLKIFDLERSGALHYSGAYESYYIQVAAEIGKREHQGSKP